jgi:hypothetical protein
MSSLIIDSHTVLGVGKTWDVPPRWVDYKLEALLGRSAQAGINRSCVMPLRDPFSDSANRKIADFCEKAPDKLIGFAAHNPQLDAGQLRRKLIDEIKSMGLKGVRADGHPARGLLDVVAEFESSGGVLPRPQ